MRNFKVVFALFAIVFFALTSCQKETIENVQSEERQEQQLFGADAPAKDNIEFTGAIEKFEKKIPTDPIDLKGEVSRNEQAASSRNSTLEISVPDDPSKVQIACNQTIIGSTRGKHNLVTNSIYSYLGFNNTNLNGGDQLYSFRLDAPDAVSFTLDYTTENLAMFLYEGDYDVYTKTMYIRRVVSYTSSHSRYGDHIGPINLAAGNYILVVDSAPWYESDYRLSIQCSNTNACDDMDSYYLGNISPQSSKWEKWSASAADGEVRTSGGNQYMRMQRKSYGAQQDVIYKTGRKSSGKYRLDADVWIYSGHSGYMNVQKQLRHEWGGQIYFYGNGTGEVQIGGQTHGFYYPQDTWMNLSIEFDFVNNKTRLYINGSHKASWSIRAHSNGSYGSYQIEGINFYPNASNSEMFVDDVCFKQL